MKINLQEALKQYEFKELTKDTGFGIELEAEIVDESLISYLDKNNLTIIEFIQKLYALRSSNQKEFFNELDKLTFNPEFKKSFIFLIKELEKFGSIFIGAKKAGIETNGWRIEEDGTLDNGIEVITPLNFKKGISYQQVLNSVPKVTDLLLKMGFNGQRTTGLHIHVSYKDKLTLSNYEAFLEKYKSKYSLFALISYLTTKEADAFFAQGNIDRKDMHFSKTLDNSFHIIDAYCKRFIEFILKENISELKKMSKTNILGSISPIDFIKPDSPYLKASFLEKYTQNYIDSIFNSTQHQSDYSIRNETIELRGLGDKEAFEKMADEAHCSKILRLALTQLSVLTTDQEPKIQNIIKSTKYMLDRSLIPSLNLYLNLIYSDIDNEKEQIDKYEDVTVHGINLKKNKDSNIEDVLSYALLNNKFIGFDTAYNTRSFITKVSSDYKVIYKTSKIDDKNVRTKVSKIVY